MNFSAVVGHYHFPYVLLLAIMLCFVCGNKNEKGKVMELSEQITARVEYMFGRKELLIIMHIPKKQLNMIMSAEWN